MHKTVFAFFVLSLASCSFGQYDKDHCYSQIDLCFYNLTNLVLASDLQPSEYYHLDSQDEGEIFFNICNPLNTNALECADSEGSCLKAAETINGGRVDDGSSFHSLESTSAGTKKIY